MGEKGHTDYYHAGMWVWCLLDLIIAKSFKNGNYGAK